MTTMHTGKIILVSITLLILALLASPALAAAPLHRVSYGGFGITEDRQGDLDTTDIIGTRVQFAGTALQTADSIWSGQGVFKAPEYGLEAKLVVTGGIYDGFNPNPGPLVQLTGDAVVTVNGVEAGTYPFVLILETFPDNGLAIETYDLHLQDPSGWHYWWISGPGHITGAPIRISY